MANEFNPYSLKGWNLKDKKRYNSRSLYWLLNQINSAHYSSSIKQKITLTLKRIVRKKYLESYYMTTKINKK